MARAFSIQDAAERLDTLPAMLTREGEAPVAAITRRGMPVLAVMPWDLYVGLLQTLTALSDEQLGVQGQGIRELLANADDLQPQQEAPSAAPHARPPHRRRQR